MEYEDYEIVNSILLLTLAYFPDPKSEPVKLPTFTFSDYVPLPFKVQVAMNQDGPSPRYVLLCYYIVSCECMCMCMCMCTCLFFVRK